MTSKVKLYLVIRNLTFISPGNKSTHLYHTRDTDFVSDFVSTYFAFCTCAEGTPYLHFSHFVLNCQKILLDILWILLDIYCIASRK